MTILNIFDLLYCVLKINIEPINIIITKYIGKAANLFI